MAWFSKNGYNPNNYGGGYRCGINRTSKTIWAAALKSPPVPKFKTTIVPRKDGTRVCLIKNGKYAKSKKLTNNQIITVYRDDDSIDMEHMVTENGSIVKVFINGELLFTYDETQLSNKYKLCKDNHFKNIRFCFVLILYNR